MFRIHFEGNLKIRHTKLQGTNGLYKLLFKKEQTNEDLHKYKEISMLINARRQQNSKYSNIKLNFDPNI